MAAVYPGALATGGALQKEEEEVQVLHRSGGKRKQKLLAYWSAVLLLTSVSVGL